MEPIHAISAAAPAPAPATATATIIVDHSVGSELHTNAPDLFRYDIDLLVPQERGAEGPLVAVGFDKRRLTGCCQTVRDFVEAGGESAEAGGEAGTDANAASGVAPSAPGAPAQTSQAEARGGESAKAGGEAGADANAASGVDRAAPGASGVPAQNSPAASGVDRAAPGAYGVPAQNSPEKTRPALSMALSTPACHQRSVQGLLSSLVPPGLPAEVSLPELTDMLSVADYLCLDAGHSGVLTEMFQAQLDRASFAELVDLLALSTAPTNAAIAQRVLADINRVQVQDLMHHAAKFDLPILRQIVDLKRSEHNEDLAWDMVSRWWAHHRGSPWPTLASLDAEGLMTPLRWHALSERQFVACATHGCFSWAQYDAWTHVRKVLTPLSSSERNGIEVTVQGQVFAPRRKATALNELVCMKPDARRLRNPREPAFKRQGRQFSITEHDDHVHVTI